jgi:GntR family transcriptional regulator
MLLHRILAGDYGPHQRLPSERDLSREFKVSRITVRQALADLTQHGHVYTRVGKGTYVCNPAAHKPLGSLFGFSESVLRHGRSPSSRLLESGLIPASDDLADRLHVPPGDALVRLHRLRLADKVPVVLELTHLPHAACSGLLDRMADDVSLYAVLEQAYGLYLTTAEITLGAALAEGRTSKLLNLSGTSAVLRTEQISFLEDGRPIEFTQATYRGDGYLFNAVLFRPRASERGAVPDARRIPDRPAGHPSAWPQR